MLRSRSRKFWKGRIRVSKWEVLESQIGVGYFTSDPATLVRITSTISTKVQTRSRAHSLHFIADLGE